MLWETIIRSFNRYLTDTAWNSAIMSSTNNAITADRITLRSIDCNKIALRVLRDSCTFCCKSYCCSCMSHCSLVWLRNNREFLRLDMLGWCQKCHRDDWYFSMFARWNRRGIIDGWFTTRRYRWSSYCWMQGESRCFRPRRIYLLEFITANWTELRCIHRARINKFRYLLVDWEIAWWHCRWRDYRGAIRYILRKEYLRRCFIIWLISRL